MNKESTKFAEPIFVFQVQSRLPDSIQVGELLHNPEQLMGLWPYWGSGLVLQYHLSYLPAGLDCQLQWKSSAERWTHCWWENPTHLWTVAVGDGKVAWGKCPVYVQVTLNTLVICAQVLFLIVG